MENEISRLVSENKYDLVIASQLSMASYHSAFGNVRAIFEEIELAGFFEHAYSEKQFCSRVGAIG